MTLLYIIRHLFSSMFSRLYDAVIRARNSLYDKGVFKSFLLGAPVISIGNITAGGTGKTPLVAFVAEILAVNGERVCILTRGYGRENPKRRVLVSDGEQIFAGVREAGDEPFELAQQLLGKAIIVADTDRRAAGIWAREKFGVSTFVLDDAFQHRRVRRDLDVVCVDAANPFGNGKLLPSGILREPLENLKRADAVVITRANLAKDLPVLKTKIESCAPNCPIFVAENKISGLIDLRDFPDAIRSAAIIKDSADRCLAFCALGNPNNFFEQLRRENFRLGATQAFPDHHFYNAGDIGKLTKKAKENGAGVLLTTAKDAVKLRNLKIDMPCFVVVNELIFAEESDFRRLLLSETRRDPLR